MRPRSDSWIGRISDGVNRAPLTKPAGPSGGETILVVDGDRPICELIQETLAAEGFRVLSATTGPEALALFRQHAAEIRAVLLDLWMLGTVACQEIYRTHPETRFILVSGMADAVALAEQAGLRVAGFIQKPFSQAELLAKVREVVAGSQNP